MKTFQKDIIKFIKKSTCSFTTIKEIKKRLEKAGFVEFFENKKWDNNVYKFLIIRNDSSIIAVEIPKTKPNSFAIITTHSDTPALLLKPNGAYVKENYLKYNIMPYGGLLNYGWLDHPLSLAGRVVVRKDNNTLETITVDFEKPLLIVPSVPIHQNAQANISLDLNMQIDLQPILSLSEDVATWDKILKDRINDKIIDYDLFTYNCSNPTFIGKNNELLVSPRIDNLTSVFSSLEAFLKAKSKKIKVFCSFNNEEIGSLTQEGADSNFLIDTLKRVAALINIDLSISLANSFIISADNTHAIHPNHLEYSDDTGVLHLNNGFAIIKETSSTTNALSSSIIKTICDKHNIKYQCYTAKNDITGGSALSTISLRHVSVLSIDVGVAQLAMHSSIETCSITDVYELYKMMYYFYKTDLKKKNNKIILN